MPDKIQGDDAEKHTPEPAATPSKSASGAPGGKDDHLANEQGRKISVPVEDLNTSNDDGAG